MDNAINAVMSTKLNDNLSFMAGNNSMGLGDTNLLNKTADYTVSGWGWWQDSYYPKVIRESYPVYVQERAQDKGKQAFEIIKALQDKKLMKLDMVADFIEAMDTLIKTL